MLFNSYVFLGPFLPFVLVVFYRLHRRNRRAALVAVSLASLVFYGYWDVRFLPLVCGSIAVNYVLSRGLGTYRSKSLLAVGIALNLLVLGFFKYSLFLYQNVAGTSDVPDILQGLILPLGISFWTFQQIAYLADVASGRVRPAPLDAHAFSMLFFPHLIAGPILLYRNISHQYLRRTVPSEYLVRSLQVGICIFAIGLFKKVCIADSMAPFAESVFDHAEGRSVSPRDAWIGTLSYSLQLYYDFSGYSDMAYGLARMFGFRVPMNFLSPYKAESILDFWARWHRSLTNFFRTYLYIPLGGNRRGVPRQIANIFFVFLVTGFWHGAGWTFIAWGAGHGILVCIAHAWRRLMLLPSLQLPSLQRIRHALPIRLLARMSTLAAVIALWVVFRSKDFDTVQRVYDGLLFKTHPLASVALVDLDLYGVLPALLVIIWLATLALPNTFELSRLLRRVASTHVTDTTRLRYATAAVLTGGVLYFAVTTISREAATFLYYNF